MEDKKKQKNKKQNKRIVIFLMKQHAHLQLFIIEDMEQFLH